MELQVYLCRGGSRIPGKAVHMYKCADLIYFFLNITETKLFHFHMIFKNEGRGVGFKRVTWIPSGSATDLRLRAAALPAKLCV